MSVSGRKRVSKWDSKEEDLSGNDYSEQQHERFYPEGKGRNGSSKRSAPDVVDDEHLKSRQQQHPGEAWPPRSSRGGDAAAMMGYYDSRKSSSEQDESWDRPRTRRSGSRSNSRSRSRSPVQRVRRDAGGGGSYDSRHKTRSGREVDGRYNRAGGDHDWEPKNRKTRDTSYYKEEDSREQYPLRVGGRSDYSSEDNNNNNNSRRETQRRDVSEREYNRISNVPCRYFALGNCRNGTSCRFSHHGARTSPGRKPQDEMFGRHDNNHRWNERSDTGKSSEGAKGNNGNWIDDMEMSPDWNYGVKTLKKPLNGEKDSLAPSYEHGSAEEVMSQQVGDRRSIGMFPSVGEKTVASSHHGFSNNSAPPVQAFSQIQSALPYQNTPIAAGGSQVLPPPPAAATHLPENGNAVSREELNHISNISASLAQLFGNGQPITNLHSTLNPIQSMQLPQVYGQKEQSSHTQTDILSNNSIHTGVVPAVTALQINNSNSLVSVAENPKPSSEEKRDKRREEEAGKEPDGRKTEETDAEKVVEEEEDDEDDGAGDENKKKEKDPKGMRAFKFSLVEIVKELLKPAWKEGGMNKDAYKNIVKKVVDKVTGAIQTGSIPQTQEKIDHYLSASKPKLTKLVQAYISKVKKS
ncbi:Zinc finger CCCH domain-containing protein 38 [Raphanus sativus]|uniref:Zinc finger CCCH domain-containing protein 38 n=1 Tax=Raphanus sativus TaxID=3726 RepID=A0A6J0P2B3_RAPSA|nr:zinc finger CCCH domain-containing protein 38 [Raphanus sativus]XP_018490936.2 zinc finger CCCH domain-containing protein 38 [Raphanus sativus]KAJ4896562.1 Zinc finger CCCH domain-containing protein 38 [Raphanus sativus]